MRAYRRSAQGQRRGHAVSLSLLLALTLALAGFFAAVSPSHAASHDTRDSTTRPSYGAAFAGIGVVRVLTYY
ncbi:MAG TPA: hypothetical protein VF120_16475, partial [Ktedonobacterales bacterium]